MVCGIDEAGRGPLAGPVYAAAVILGGNFSCDLLNDSKKLSSDKRDQLQKYIKDNALAWGIGNSSHEEIDQINILQAALLAMKRAFEDMQKKLSSSLCDISVIVDGNKTPELEVYGTMLGKVSCTAVVKADAMIPEVMAASILAKTARDYYMNEMSLLYPQYGYDRHKGYGTAGHIKAIQKYGHSPIQRKSFKIRDLQIAVPNNSSY